MALDWSQPPVTFRFASGLSQRSDPHAVTEASLDAALDCQFDRTGGLVLRKPFLALGGNILGGGTISGARQLIPNGDELLLLTSDSVYSWNAQLAKWALRGTHLACAVNEHSLLATSNDQVECDRAELGNVIMFAWTASVAGVFTQNVYVAALDKATGAVIYPPSLIFSGNRPRLVALSTRILLFVNDGSELSPGNLNVIPFNPANLIVAGLSATVILAAGAYNLYYDVARIGGQDAALVVSRRVTTTGYSIIKVTAGISITSTINFLTCDGPIAVSVDPTGTVAQIVRANGTNINGELVTVLTLATTINGQAIGTVAATPVSQIAATHAALSGGFYTCNVFWTDSEANDASDYRCKTNTVDTAGTLGSQKTFVLKVDLASRAFAYNGRAYVWLCFAGQQPFYSVTSGQFQNTYFLYRDDGFLVAKSTDSVAGGPNTVGHLPGVALTNGTTTFSWSGIERRIITIGSGLQSSYGARAPRDITFTFDSNAARRSARLGNTVYIAAGEVLQYDGVQLVECGFHIYPWAYIAAGGAGGGNIPTGAYAYKGTLRWDNAQGESDRSTSAAAIEGDIVAGPKKMTIFATPVSITHKTANLPAFEVWRTTINPTADAPFYLLTSKDPSVLSGDNAFIPNDPTLIATAELFDNFSDATLATKEANPENGAVLESLSPPPAQIIVSTDERIFLAGVANDPDRVWYSRQRVDGLVASFHDANTFTVPREGGAITALGIASNGTLIVWRQTATYAFPGEGFDNVGSGQNYGPVRILSLDVGALSQEAVATMDVGILFKSSKGWHVLDKSFQITYVGSKVYDYDSEAILATHVVPGQQQVRVVSAARILIFDYLVGEWSEMTVAGALHACVWNGSYVYLTDSGPMVEQAADYSAMGASAPGYGLDVETQWLHLADIQGFGRVREIAILGEWRSRCAIRVRIARDYQNNGGGPHDWAFYQDKTIIATPEVLGAPLQVAIGPSQQQCQAIKVRLTVTFPGQFATLQAIDTGLDTVWKARLSGTVGNAYTLAFVGDLSGGAQSLTEVGNVITYHYAPNPSSTLTVGSAEDYINAHSALIQVGTSGTRANALSSAMAFSARHLAGGLAPGVPTDECARFTGLSFRIGVKPGIFKRLPAAQKG